MIFYDWYILKCSEYGSMVTPTMAAKMLGVSRQYIEKIVKSGRLQKHYYEDLPFIGMSQINAEFQRRKQGFANGDSQ